MAHAAAVAVAALHEVAVRPTDGSMPLGLLRCREQSAPTASRPESAWVDVLGESLVPRVANNDRLRRQWRACDQGMPLSGVREY